MARRFWTANELDDLAVMTWDQFHALYPHRSYDAWEVKRRRVNGSAGSKTLESAAFLERMLGRQLVMNILSAIETYVQQSAENVGLELVSKDVGSNE